MSDFEFPLPLSGDVWTAHVEEKALSTTFLLLPEVEDLLVHRKQGEAILQSSKPVLTGHDWCVGVLDPVICSSNF